MKLFSKLDDRTAEQLIGGKNDKWQPIPIPDDPNTPEEPGNAPPGLIKNFDGGEGKAPSGLFDRNKQPKGWSQGF